MVDSLVSFAIEKLDKLLKDEVASLVGVTKELRKLSSAFTAIKAVLEDAETRRLKETSVKDWLQKLKDLAYDIDDILDEWTTEALKSQGDEDDQSHCCNIMVRNFLSPFSCFGHVVFRHRIGNRTKDALERLEDIEKEKNGLHFKTDNAEKPHEIGERETSSQVDTSTIVGRENERNEIVKLLLNEILGELIEVPIVISIIGMGGLGKTTLAQLAYNDEDVKGHFDMRMWVCVSEEFDVKRITKSIIEAATQSSCEHLDLDLLQSRLHEMLQTKRFLLVLDDIWSEDGEKWGKLKLPFQAGASGSRIIITTRNENVALAMGSAHIHKLAVLSDEDCWLLFSHRALERRSAEERSELEEIGKKIVKKCGGVPLAVKTIGSAMCSRRTRSEWELILESDIWNSHNVLQGILPALLLSYHDLPPALKQCFAYFSIFPKDWEIEKDVIVKLWVAQGFICSKGSEDMEEIGGWYFDDLLRRSLLQDAEQDEDKKIVSCKMHDLVHDVAQSVAGSDCSLVEIRKQVLLNPSNLRHSLLIDIHEDGEYGAVVASFWPALYKAEKLRTLLFDSRIPMVPQILFHHWRRLRALDLSGTSIQELHQTVGKLKHLRYLNLSNTDIEELPEGVSNCRNLQTLILNGCLQIKKLPGGLRKMISLRHLELKDTNLKYLPQGIGRLTNLRTLTKFIVGGGNKGCKWGELKRLNHLQGRLEITGLENVRSGEEAREGELYKKQRLHELWLDCGYGELNEDVLEILQPHTNLKVVRIDYYKGLKLPKWIEDTVFSNLVQVKLSFCLNCKQLPGLGKLPSLKYLEIKGMEEVRKVGGEFSGDDNNEKSGGGGGGGDDAVSFPKLQTLIFRSMRNWEEWELRGGDGEVMPSLLQLEIYGCPKLKKLPSNLPPLLQKLVLWESDVGMSSGGPLPLLPNLNHLLIGNGNEELTSLPGGWLGQLKALQTLYIWHCSNLRSLPEELQHLTMLQQLKIYDCPVLEERCREGGEDRYKIAHIPYISILIEANYGDPVH